MPGQGDIAAEVEGVALVVVESAVAGDRSRIADVGGEIGKAAADGASGGGDLVRIGEMNLGAVREARGGDGDAELEFFVALAVERSESAAAWGAEVDE